MKILAVDTTTMIGSVAITDNERVVAEKYLDRELTHAEQLLPGIEQVIKSSSLKISDIDAFAVAIGPGSFTGLRIGVATIKGLAFSLGKPVVGVSSLESLAFHYVEKPNLVCPMFDARKGEVYFALYKPNPEIKRLEVISPESVKNPEESVKELSKYLPKLQIIIFPGDGARRYRDIISRVFKDKALIPEDRLASPWAPNTAFLALPKLLSGEFENLDLFEPNYIRKSEAELMP